MKNARKDSQRPSSVPTYGPPITRTVKPRTAAQVERDVQRFIEAEERYEKRAKHINVGRY
jgi:hypothetical protein